MTDARFAMRPSSSVLGALVLAGALWPAGPSQAQDGHAHATAAPQQSPTAEHQSRENALVRIVRDSTRRFQDVAVAREAGYVPMFGCVTGSSEGVMGVHFVNASLLDGVLDPTRPEILVYEPKSRGRFQLVAADYLVLSDVWHATNPAPPEMLGQLFHLFESPNRFGLPAFYTLHVWAWRDNPQGTFANWNPRVSCDDYEGANP
jgi:hypothetical protein